MSTEPTNANAGMIERIKNILLQPQAEWDRIAGEPADVSKLYLGYVLPLAAFAALCSFVGFTLLWGFSVRTLVGAVVQTGVGAAGVFIMAYIANTLAPNFGSQQDMGQAHKLAAYGATAGFLANVFLIVPALAMLAIVGLYSLALLYIGLPRLMKTPEDKRIAFLAVIVLVAIVVWILIGTVLAATGLSPGPRIADLY